MGLGGVGDRSFRRPGTDRHPHRRTRAAPAKALWLHRGLEASDYRDVEGAEPDTLRGATLGTRRGHE
jgi:hypothetical protein